MCGIVGYIGRQDAAPILVEGLHRLEYRGYDSAGIAVVRGGALRLYKSRGKVRDLERVVPENLKGAPGIAHTRWATHGEPSDRNAHPHSDTANRIAIVHNGIIENSDELRAQLQAKGVEFRSDTDSEVLAHLIAAMGTASLVEDVRAALRLVTGTYGLVVLDAQRPEALVVARQGSPVILGIGEREMLVASDAAALVRHTRSIVHLDDGELAVVRADGFETSTLAGGATVKVPLTVEFEHEALTKGDHAHFMEKEIHEQPDALRRTLGGRLERRFHTAHLGGVEMSARELLEIRRVKILGCGSAYISGCVGAQMIEQLARIPANAEPASEFRYRNPVIEPDTLYVAVSQSGETFDTLAAVQEVTRKGGRVLGIVNVVGSSIARACGRGIYIHAGPEIAVVSTKSFTCTSVAFALLALHLGRLRDLSSARGEALVGALEALPDQVSEIMQAQHGIAEVAASLAPCHDIYFVGRAAGYAVAMEGALKLKEVSYKHAESYPASELKHGPLALIDPQTPSIIVLPRDELFAKNISTIEEIHARRGPVHVLTQPGAKTPAVEGRMEVPASVPELDPVLLNVPLQLLAYRVAQACGTEIDQPRNLAKSVTVE
ncbi:MAG TPA: glutamine--fructose-6-phosphate transaminase (isomerizing) [Steroidobacteraceae bacterium]|nr:glutamine--fructose-6-phosphate transaminase (isomerizing) [Steroidobacteraceae bacterium]